MQLSEADQKVRLEAAFEKEAAEQEALRELAREITWERQRWASTPDVELRRIAERTF